MSAIDQIIQKIMSEKAAGRMTEKRQALIELVAGLNDNQVIYTYTLLSKLFGTVNDPQQDCE